MFEEGSYLSVEDEREFQIELAAPGFSKSDFNVKVDNELLSISAEKEEEEQDDFIVNPFQIEEGIVECRCGSKRVYSYSKQCRSGDEGVTSFHQCLKCKAKWSLNN